MKNTITNVIAPVTANSEQRTEPIFGKAGHDPDHRPGDDQDQRHHRRDAGSDQVDDPSRNERHPVSPAVHCRLPSGTLAVFQADSLAKFANRRGQVRRVTRLLFHHHHEAATALSLS
jgi:hypothetical protein